MNVYVVDTSAVIEKAISKLIKEGEVKGRIIVPMAVISELENQANRGHEIGFIGLEELQEIRKLPGVEIEFSGERPNEMQIKFAKSGYIDAMIREIAFREKAILITADMVQAESGKAFGLKVMHIKTRPVKEKLTIEKFFDDRTMSVHLKANCNPMAKKGAPGNWKLEQVDEKKLSSEEIQAIAKEIVEKSRVDPETMVEISRRGSTIVQYKNYRIVIVKPPVSDGWEITAVRPLKKLNIENYKLPEALMNRIKEKSRGIIISGEPGSGKSTFCQALAELYMGMGKVVKTIESPRDLQLPDEITQYSKNFTSSEEIHDILFLSRPDNIIFDEMRDTPDFELYIDLRLGGSECIGVLHGASPIDAIQRFISRMEVGMIPSVVDTVLFIQAGKIAKVYSQAMIVKVPTGMTESDLSRPVVEVRDFETDKLEYEIYSYGEQTVVIPVSGNKKTASQEIAEKSIEKEIRKYSRDAKVEVVGDNKAIVYVPEEDMARIIGKKGVMINQIEKEIGMHIDVRELIADKQEAKYNVSERGNNLIFFVQDKIGNKVDFLVDGSYLFTAIAGKRGEIKVNKKSDIGKKLVYALDNKRNVELKA